MEHFGMLEIAGFAGILVPIAFGCVLPIFIIWFIFRYKKNQADHRTQIVLAAIEKNPDMDIEELLKKVTPKQKLLKEKLLNKLLAGSVITLIGVVLLGFGAFWGYVGGSDPDDIEIAACFGLVLLAVGIAFLVNYFVGKKMLTKEIEAEEKQLTTQA